MNSPLTSVYLSGWEYNRLLRPDPFAARNSGLPASVLWHGGHQFWMFEKVLCTKEAYENEALSAEMLGWASGAIFRDLRKADFIEEIDWKHLDKDLQIDLGTAHAEMQCHLERTGTDLAALVKSGDTVQLEFLKSRLMEPFTKYYECLLSGTPTSLSSWFDASVPVATKPTSSRRVREREVQRVQAAIAAKVGEIQSFDLCDKPCFSAEQADVQRRVEKPNITELLLDQGEFEDCGFEKYLKKLLPERHHYDATNAQMLQGWPDRLDDLKRLREIAQERLWPVLHREWLPAIIYTGEPAEPYLREIDDVLKHPAFTKLLSGRTRGVLVAGLILGSGIGAAHGAQFVANVLGAPGSAGIVGEVTGPIGGAAGKHVGEKALPRRDDRMGVFFQAVKEEFGPRESLKRRTAPALPLRRRRK